MATGRRSTPSVVIDEGSIAAAPRTAMASLRGTEDPTKGATQPGQVIAIALGTAIGIGMLTSTSLSGRRSPKLSPVGLHRA